MRQAAGKAKEEQVVVECSHPPKPVPIPPPVYSSMAAQIIQSTSNLLNSVSRDTLIVVLLFVALFAAGYISYKQIDVIDHNTAVMNEMKVLLQEMVAESHAKK
jgi:hypothetical protein